MFGPVGSVPWVVMGTFPTACWSSVHPFIQQPYFQDIIPLAIEDGCLDMSSHQIYTHILPV